MKTRTVIITAEVTTSMSMKILKWWVPRNLTSGCAKCDQVQINVVKPTKKK